MSNQRLLDAIEQYRTGLDAAVTILRQLHEVAGRQHAGSESRDFARLATDGDERDRLTQALVAIEPGLRIVREIVFANHDEAATLAGYDTIVSLRQTAAELINAILKSDEAAMRALSNAELARRAAANSLEQGETTLAAYRRVLTPPISTASVLNLRG